MREIDLWTESGKKILNEAGTTFLIVRRFLEVDIGGGFGPTGWFGDPRSKITVRVIYKDKKYEQSIMTPIPDVTLISIFAKVSSIKRRIVEIIAKYKKKLFS